MSKNNNKMIKNAEGFTLVELLIYMGLLIMMVLIFTNIFVAIMENQLSSKNSSNLADDGRYIYTRLIHDINRADAVIEPSAYASPSSTLILEIDGANYTYDLDGTNLTITDPTDTNRLNGTGTIIQDLTFTKIGSTSAKSTIQMEFTIAGIIEKTGRFETVNFQTTAGLR